MPSIKLLDGKQIKFKNVINGLEIAKKISKSLEKDALVMEVDGKLKDLSFEIHKDSIKANDKRQGSNNKKRPNRKEKHNEGELNKSIEIYRND